MSSCLLWSSEQPPKPCLFTHIALGNFFVSFRHGFLGWKRTLPASAAWICLRGHCQKVIPHKEQDMLTCDWWVVAVTEGQLRLHPLYADHSIHKTSFPSRCSQMTTSFFNRREKGEDISLDRQNHTSHYYSMGAVMWQKTMYKASITTLSCCYIFICCSAGLKSGNMVIKGQRYYFHTLLGLSSWRTTCEKWLSACICLLALANGQQAEMMCMQPESVHCQ